jgi:putative ABC transport system permease protein
MFFLTYLRRELRRRARQSVFIALGLALGVGLVVTVSAASAGVNKAQSKVLSALYGVGTDVTVTGGNPGTPTGAAAQPPPVVPGKSFSNILLSNATVSMSKVAQAARLSGVSAAAGVLSFSDVSMTFGSGSHPPVVNSLTIDGVGTGHVSLGPLSGATLISGHAFTTADTDAAVAVVDSGYAASHSLKVGSALSIGNVRYTVIGIVRQPQQGGTPTDVYLPLTRAVQAVSAAGWGIQPNDVNTIYVSAASAADVSAVSKEISALLPGTTVTTASSLASEVTGSLSTASKLVNDLGRWLSVLVLIAAFALATLLTMAAVARRAREFGTLKAIGWRSRRIIAQVLGESLALGVAGAAAGIGLGLAGAAIIAAAAPALPATVTQNDGSGVAQAQQASAGSSLSGTTTHVVSVPLHPSVTIGVIVLAVILALAGGLLAGALGSWRISQLRPADALARVA